MKAGIGFCRRPLTGALMVGLLAIGTSAFGQEIRFMPIRSAPLGSAPGTVGASIAASFDGTCWDYAIDAGGVEVDLDIQAFGWGSAMGAPSLGAIQATVVSAGYNNGVGGNLVPKGWPGTPSNGAYQAKSVCSTTLRPCVAPFDATCSGFAEGFCIGNPNWVMPACANDLPAIATPTLDYGWATAAQVDCNTDGGGVYTMGGLILEVPANAAGTYVIALDPDPNNTFMTSGAGTPVPGVTFTCASITVTTGKCCSAISANNTVCEDNLTIAQCNQRPGPRKFTADEFCTGDVSADCPTCQSNADCSDGDACTTDTCVIPAGEQFGACAPPQLNYDPVVNCCNSTSGALTPIDDGDVCTDNICNADGSVSHPFNTAPCNDGNNCTRSDVCADGVCEGSDVNLDPCTTDADCAAGTCDVAAGFCSCTLDTPLTCSIAGECMADGEVFTAQVGIGAGSEQIFGGQFLLNYPSGCYDFLGLAPCEGTTFDAVIEYDVDEAAGTIWYAATTDPAAPVGTNRAEAILCIDFAYVGGCACDGNICFDSVNPRNTILTNEMGNRVPTTAECCPSLRGHGEIDLNVPDDAGVNADCGVPTADVTWDTASASDTCDGALDIVCVAAHDGGLPINHLIPGGGEFPQGTSFFRCEASNSCGDTAVKVWTVDVSDQHGLDVEVHLSPTILGDVFTRGITFGLYLDCASEPVEVCEEITFGGPYNFHAHGSANLKVDKGNYMCITAQDMLHTLRAAADVVCIDNRWTAIFKGDPLQGGNWLIGGNLDAWKANGNANTIDVLDAGMYLSVIAGNQGSTAPGADTGCGPYMEAHADINADGVVDSADYSFILDNFLAASKDACCPHAGIGANTDTPYTALTHKQLRQMGFSELIVADLDHNGVLDTVDMQLYQQGVEPVQRNKAQRGSRE